MASGTPGAIAATSAVLTPPASDQPKFQAAAGKNPPQSSSAAATQASLPQTVSVLPQAANGTAPNGATHSSGTNSAGSSTGKAKSTATSNTDPQSFVDQINKNLNDSGRASQFRVDPDSDKYIQQVNPANGEVVAEYSVSEFPALAQSIGVSGLLVDDRA